MIKVWGRTTSVNVQKAMWTIGELGLAHERYDAGGAFGGLDDPAYLAMNPNARIPVIEYEGQHLWESNAIVRLLCALHSEGALWPTDPWHRARADRWMDWQAASLLVDMTTVFWGLIRTPESGRDWVAIGDAASRVNSQMGILDAHLGYSDWVAGDSMTMGDIAIGALVHRWSNLPMQRPDHSHIADYYNRLKQRPAFAEHVMIPLS